jgi:hypothetical protein
MSVLTAHELARVLLEQEDLPIAVSAMGNNHFGAFHRQSHGQIKVGLAQFHTTGGPLRHVIVGDFAPILGHRPGTNQSLMAVVYEKGRDPER